MLGSFAVLAFYMYRNSECTPPEVPWVLNSRGVFWGISALAVLSWLPLLLYEVSYRSNLYKLFKVHLSDTHRVAGLLTTLEALFQVFKRFLFADYPFAALSNVLGAWTAALFCIALVALFCDYLMRSTRVVRYTWTAIGAGIACLVAALTSVKPPVHHYYFHFVSIVPALIAGIAFSRSVQIVWPRKEIASLYQRIWLWISRALAVVFLLIFVCLLYTSPSPRDPL